MSEVLKETEITEENIESFIVDNMRRSEKKYNQFTNMICQECNAILDADVKVCPNCGSERLAGLFTDGKR